MGHARGDAGEVAGNEPDAGGLQALGHGCVGRGLEFLLLRLHGGQVHGDRARGQLLLGLGFQGLDGEGRGQQVLGRDTAPVEAGAAELATLDERDGKARRRAGQGRVVAAGAGPDHDKAFGRTRGHP